MKTLFDILVMHKKKEKKNEVYVDVGLVRGSPSYAGELKAGVPRSFERI
jgi:predicted RNA-binding protein associated with RNAse of E/G family